MGKSSRRISAIEMATALQQAVAMYCMLVEQAKGHTDLTEDQIAAIVDGVATQAMVALRGARDAGLIAPLPTHRPPTPSHGHPVVWPSRALH